MADQTELQTRPSTVPVPLHPTVVVIAAASALSSGVALVLSIVTDRPLWLASTFVFVPGLIALTAVTVMARRSEQTLFLVRLRRGAAAGLGATLAYDLCRWAIEVTDITSTNSFIAIRVFGTGLTDAGPTTALATSAGWLFHFTNGVGFAIAFLFVAAGRHWLWAVAYALVLEAFMVGLYPGWLDITVGSEFLSVSIAGHLAYGAVLGAVAQRCP